MNKVHLHKSLAQDPYLGHVDHQGNVFESRFGPDKKVGRVELNTGRIYETRFGPDQYLGRTDLESGKVYLAKIGPDEYLGTVSKEGKMSLHKPFAVDEYIGVIKDMGSLAHGGAAMILLVLPAYEELHQNKDREKENKSVNKEPDA